MQSRMSTFNFRVPKSPNNINHVVLDENGLLSTYTGILQYSIYATKKKKKTDTHTIED